MILFARRKELFHEWSKEYTKWRAYLHGRNERRRSHERTRTVGWLVLRSGWIPRWFLARRIPWCCHCLAIRRIFHWCVHRRHLLGIVLIDCTDTLLEHLLHRLSMHNNDKPFDAKQDHLTSRSIADASTNWIFHAWANNRPSSLDTRLNNAKRISSLWASSLLT